MAGLLGISRMIANSALNLGGSRIAWQRAKLCPATRPNGSPCFDEDSGSAYIDCPVCRGNGTVYDRAVVFNGVYTDNSNRFEFDETGGLVQGKKTLSIPHHIPITIMKERASDELDGYIARRIARDRFTILSPDNKPVEVLFLMQEAVDPFINSGVIYRIVEVANTY